MRSAECGMRNAEAECGRRKAEGGMEEADRFESVQSDHAAADSAFRTPHSLIIPVKPSQQNRDAFRTLFGCGRRPREE